MRQFRHPGTGPELVERIRRFGADNPQLARKESGGGLAAWFVSNCASDSDRESVVGGLRSTGLTVDVYGRGSCSDPGRQCEQNCLQLLNTTYKFYLAFENSICADYVTEKFFKVLPYNVIPVVLNGANMSSIAPPNSYIDVKDFISIKGMCKYNKLL